MKRLRMFCTLSTKREALVIRAICASVLVIIIAALFAQTEAHAARAQATPAAEGWVVLPVDDYRALREAAFPAERESPPPPVEATLTRVEYELNVDGELASGVARLTIDVIKDGWVRVAIPAGLMVRSAQLDGRPVSLVSRSAEKAGSSLLLSRTGRSILTLSIVAPVSSTAGTELLQLPVSASAMSRASLVLPRLGVDVRITNGLLLERSETAGATRLVAHGRGNETLTFAWKRKVDDVRSTQPLRLRGALTELVGLGEDSTQVNAEVQIEVLQGLAKEVRVQLPPQMTVNQVSGAMVADWESNPGELVVTFLEPQQQATRFTIAGEARLPREGRIDIPLMRLSAAERESGGLAVEVLGAGEIKDRKSAGLDEAEAADLGQLIANRQSPSLIAFRLRPAEGKSARSLSLDVARYTPQAVLTANVEEARYNVLITEDGKMLVQARLAVRNNQRNFLKVSLPSTAVLWSASVARRPIRPGRAPDGSMLLPLEKARSGDEAPAFAVEVVYLDRVSTWTDKGRTKLSLLTLDMPVSKSGALIHHSPIFRLTPLAGSFRGAPFETPVSAVLRSTPSAEQPSATIAAIIPERNLAAEAQGAPVTRPQPASRPVRPVRNLPIRVAFPHFGPSIFLVSELTSENQAPVVEFDYQRDRKRGAE